MRVLLHIGTEKTGTTSLQSFLGSQRDELGRAGWLFPESLGARSHSALVLASAARGRCEDLLPEFGLEPGFDRAAFRRDIRDRLAAEIDEVRPECLLVSSEHCSSRLLTPPEIGAALEFLSEWGREVEVVVYLRRQDLFLLSGYSTAVRVGETEPLSMPDEGLREFRFNYLGMLKRWRKETGSRPLVRVFEAAQLSGGDAVVDFAETVGLPLDVRRMEVPRENEILSWKAIELLRRMNVYLPKRWEADGDEVRGRLIEWLSAVDEGERPLPTRQLVAFYRSFQRENRKVARQFLGRANGELFRADPAWDRAGEDVDLGVEDAVRLFSELWLRQARGSG